MNYFNKAKALNNKQFWKRNSIAFASALAFMVSVAGPANAETVDPYTYDFDRQYPVQTLPVQTLTVSPNAAAPTIQRDSFSATSPEELEEIRAEKEAKERAEQAARAEAERAAAAANNASSSNTSAGSGGNTSSAPSASQSIPAGGIIASAQKWVGVTPYVFGGTTPAGFDCSGYVQYVFAENGISLPRGATAQGQSGTIIPKSEARAGDLVWWSAEGHIGIYDGAGGMYDAPMPGRMVQHRVGSLWGNPVFVRL